VTQIFLLTEAHEGDYDLETVLESGKPFLSLAAAQHAVATVCTEEPEWVRVGNRWQAADPDDGTHLFLIRELTAL